ncbi:MAG: hypothetical protein WC321_06635 [Candidatus Omnitrophota bacterium]|jgi:hypothetical protein
MPTQENNKTIYLLIFLISFVLLALELLYPLIISVLLLSFAPIYIIFYVMFGLGAGGFLAYLYIDRLTLKLILKINLWLAWSIFLTFLSMIFIRELPYIAFILPLIFTLFGLIMGFCFIKGKSHLVYAFSMFGSGLGVLFLWAFLRRAGGESTLILLCLFLILSNIILNKKRALTAGILSGAFFFILFIGNSLTHQIDMLKIMPVKTYNYSDPQLSSWFSSLEKTFAHMGLKDKNTALMGTAWSLLSRVDILKKPVYQTKQRPSKEVAKIPYGKSLFDRNQWISMVRDKDDSLGNSALYPYLLTPDARVVIVGLGGGNDILHLKYFSPREITGIEINPAIVRLMSYPSSSYRLLDRLYLMDGRGFFRGRKEKFDSLIFNFADTYIRHPYLMLHMENYLYTVEAVKEYFSRLSEEGIIYMAKHFNIDPYSKEPFALLRILSTAIEGLRENGTVDYQEQIVVIQYPHPHEGVRNLLGEEGALLIKKRPFKKEEIDRIYTMLPRGSKIIYAPYYNSEDNYFKSLILAADKQKFYRSYPWDITPLYDNKPFLYQRYKNKFPEQRNLKIIFFITSVIFLSTIAFSFLRGTGYRNKKFIKLIIYFALLGAGFMIFEMALIHKFNLYLWSPVISMAVIIPVLLITAGTGSYLSRKKGRKFISACILVLALAMLIFPSFIMLIMNYVPQYLPLKIAFTILILLPLGLLLGTPFPSGLKICRESFGEKAASLMWAINGIYAPLGAILAINLAMTYGFTLLFYVAGIIYILIFLNYTIW